MSNVVMCSVRGEGNWSELSHQQHKVTWVSHGAVVHLARCTECVLIRTDLPDGRIFVVEVPLQNFMAVAKQFERFEQFARAAA